VGGDTVEGKLSAASWGDTEVEWVQQKRGRGGVTEKIKIAFMYKIKQMKSGQFCCLSVHLLSFHLPNRNVRISIYKNVIFSCFQ
jgi:hypothetical protein